MPQRPNAGFTLVELMIVVAIVAVLAAIAIPSYQSFTVRAKMAEVLMGLSGCRTLISEVYPTGTLPGPNGWGCEASAGKTRYIRSITTSADGVVTAVADGFNNPAIDGRTIQLIPYKDATTPLTAADAGRNVAQWVCVSQSDGGIPANFLPTSCRERMT
jgi:type IV pilus assembly protein PilA